jgi:hypothetical protein
VKRFGLVVMTLAFTAYPAELKPQAVKAWQEYVQSARASMREHLRPERQFLKIDENQESLSKLRSGKILVLPGGSQSLKKVPSGVIHDWLGAAFIANTTLNEVLSLVRDYDRYKEFYAPSVIDSRALARGSSQDRFSMLLMNKSLFLNAALDSDYQCTYVRINNRRWYGTTESTRVQEIENYGAAGQRALRQGEGNGFIWRLFSITRLEERDGGVYVELEAIALSRDIPSSLRWIIEPIVSRISRNSLTISLRQTAAAVSSRAVIAEGKRLDDVPSYASIRARRHPSAIMDPGSGWTVNGAQDRAMLPCSNPSSVPRFASHLPEKEMSPAQAVR